MLLRSVLFSLEVVSLSILVSSRILVRTMDEKRNSTNLVDTPVSIKIVL